MELLLLEVLLLLVLVPVLLVEVPVLLEAVLELLPVVALEVVLLLPADLLVAETEDREVEAVVDLEPAEDLVVVLLPVLPETLPDLLVVARVEEVEERVTAELLLRLVVLLLPPVALCLEVEVVARLTVALCLPCSVEFLLPQ